MGLMGVQAGGLGRAAAPSKPRAGQLQASFEQPSEFVTRVEGPQHTHGWPPRGNGVGLYLGKPPRPQICQVLQIWFFRVAAQFTAAGLAAMWIRREQYTDDPKLGVLLQERCSLRESCDCKLS